MSTTLPPSAPVSRRVARAALLALAARAFAVVVGTRVTRTRLLVVLAARVTGTRYP